jgi:hypothetical protein
MPLKDNSATTIKPSTSAIPKSSTSSATGGSVFQSYQAGAGIQNNNNAAAVGAGIVAGEYNPAATTTTETAGQPVTSTATMQTGPAIVLNPLNWNWGTGKKWLVIGGAALVIGMIVYFVYFRKKK